MASSHSPLRNLVLLTLIATTLHVSYTSAAGNVELIDKLCGVTYAPAACTSCVKNGLPPPGPNWTNVDVLEGMMRCAENDFQQLEQDIMTVINDVTVDEKVRDVMSDCNKPIQAAISNGGVVLQSIAEQKLADAKAQIDSLIFQKLDECNSDMKAAGVTPPPAVMSGLLGVENDFKITQQILSSLTN